MKKNKKVYTICIASMMAALSIILDILSVRTDSSKITLYSLPLLLSGFLFGPWVGLLSGLASGLISQIILYGFSVTTPIWIIAPMLWGFLSGILFHKAFKKREKLWVISLVVIITSISATLVNTLAIYLDGLIFHYPTPYVITQLGIRILTSLGLSVAYITLIYLILPNLKPLTDSSTYNAS